VLLVTLLFYVLSWSGTIQTHNSCCHVAPDEECHVG